MKRISLRLTAALLICLCPILCAACAATEGPAEEEKPGKEISIYDLRVEMLKADPSLPEMLTVSSADKHPEELFKYLSDVDYEKVESFFLAYAADGMAYEIAAVVMKEKADVSECERSLENHVKGRVELYKNYAPEEVAKAEQARILTSGRCVALIMCDGKAAVEEAMRTYLAAQSRTDNG